MHTLIRLKNVHKEIDVRNERDLKCSKPFLIVGKTERGSVINPTKYYEKLNNDSKMTPIYMGKIGNE